jgi:hypothetical protein
MPDVYKDGKSPEQRLRDRLRNSGDIKEWPATGGLLETNPTRTFTNIYKSSTQQSSTIAGQPRGSNPRAVGVGGGFFTSNDEAWQRDFGKPKGLQLHPGLFQRKR